MPKSIDQLRRDAKALRRAYEALDPHALERLRVHPPRKDGAAPRHADFLHVVAQENNFASWPQLAWAAETIGLDRAEKLQRLKIAVAHGQGWRIDQLLAETPDLAEGAFGLQCALYRRDEVEVALSEDPSLATRNAGPRRPILHLAFSRYIHTHPELEADMLAIGELLLACGADVNDGYAPFPGSDHQLSALYGALGHADNMPLASWLLGHGADPNDGESLYHATELGHRDGVKLLLAHGADPKGANALLRAMDFDDVETVRLLIDAGARADDFNPDEIAGEVPWTVPALHQAARRMSSREMIDLLLDAGADPRRPYQGVTPYARARIFGNRVLAEALEAAGHATVLNSTETVLARIADGDPPGAFINAEALPEAAQNMLREILHLPGKLDQVQRLVAAGMPYDRPDSEGLTPVQVAGWEGLPDVLEYFIGLKPDLSHINNYGGTLLSTIIHGSENNPNRTERDHVGCLELALNAGAALPRRAITLAGDPTVAAFLADWAEAHPGQVVEGGAS